MITKIIPKLPFTNKEKTLDYYSIIGFTLLSDYGDYLLLSLDNIEIHFFYYPELIPEKSDFMIYLKVDESIEKIYQEVQSNGIKIHPNGNLETKPWNQKEFAIIDPNGTLLTFGQSV